MNSLVFRHLLGKGISCPRYAHNLSVSKNEILPLTKAQLKTSKSESGVKVASVENYSPICHLSAAVKVGSRNENSKNLGITHFLRNAAHLSTKDRTTFSLVRELECVGAKLNTMSTRECLVYTITCARDYTDFCFETLAAVLTRQTFKPWEVAAVVPHLHVDKALHRNDTKAVLFEMLHKAALRGGLGNSLYAEDFMIGEHTPEMLHDFVSENFTSHKMAIAGLGIHQDHLTGKVDQHLKLTGDVFHNAGDTKFRAGEARVEADLPFVHVAMATESAPHSAKKEWLSFEVLKVILGDGSHIRNSGVTNSTLTSAAAKCTKKPFCVSSFNIGYSDTGMFGLYVVGHPNDMMPLLNAVFAETATRCGKITDQDLEVAKNRLKSNLLLDRERSDNVILMMASELALLGSVTETDDVFSAIDALTVQDIRAAASRVIKAKPAMAAIGRLHSTPYADEMIKLR